MTDHSIERARSTRGAILGVLGDSPAGMTTAELARALGVHPNAVRKQMRRLIADGSVGAERELSGRRGRPAVRYRAAGARREALATRRLARMLVELINEVGADESRVEEFGRRQASRLTTAREGRLALLDLMTAMGFSPRETTPASELRRGGLELVLGNCPFSDAVNADGGRLVCVLHRGISRGLVELTPSAHLTGFVARDPETAGCMIAAEGLRTPGEGLAEPPQVQAPDEPI
jgi:predicted ArsR family transcriptional regulator